MAPISLKIIVDDGAVIKTLIFDTTTTVAQAHAIVKEKILSLDQDKEYGFFLSSADDECSGIWLESHRNLEYYMLREGDSLCYLEKKRNLRLRMLDGSVKTLQVDESKNVGELMSYICDKIGATNYEEYGLCHENIEVEETKSMTGTLTLKRKAQAREKDTKMEQLSKKLKTDDNVEWLDQHKTLRELRVDPKETLVFKRRLFYSDRKVDARDPVQLNLLYVQTRDAILDGKQVVTEEKAIEFAGLQCQIHYEDFNEEKHKPGFIENLREFLPEQYATSWGIEKKIFKEHKKHQGLSPLEAKYLYTKTARELPTYGVTFFLVKEKYKDKKKLVPRLLGINSQCILRLDEQSKKILAVWPLTQVKSYRAANESFTLNFGDYSQKEYAVKTNEAFRIKDILEGYIDIIKKQLMGPTTQIEGDEGEPVCEDHVEQSRGTYFQNIVPSKIVEETFVGPSRIISVEQGHKASEGTKITTVHEVVTVNRENRSQQGLKGEIASDAGRMFGKRLNRINSLSVKTVVLLSDDENKENLADVHRIVGDMENELPAIVKGVRECAQILDEAQSKRLLEELDELCDYINKLSQTVHDADYDSPDKLSSASDVAKKLADISAQMYLSLDPACKRRSLLIKSSRNSFIADEKTEANLRKLSLKSASESVQQSLSEAYSELDKSYEGSFESPKIVGALEKSVTERMGKLNAAVALLLNAHSDPEGINYSTATTCMVTIKELIPELIHDVKTLNSYTEDDEAKSSLTNEIKKLINRTAALCRLNGTDDSQSYEGSFESPKIVGALEKSVTERMGKLNAAVALLLNAHSDPEGINYSTATTCMVTIKELIPELIHDVKTLNSYTEDDEAKSSLTNEIKKLINRTAALCRLNGTDDSQKLQQASNEYGDVARKLIYTFKRGAKQNQCIDKENEIMDLALLVGETTSELLLESNDLIQLLGADPRAEELDGAGVKCAVAAKDLYICAQLTSPSIQEPHCQSALKEACENLSTSLHHLGQTYKPIVEDPGRHYYGKRLNDKVAEINKTIERLMQAYPISEDDSKDDADTSDVQEQKRIKFIATIKKAMKTLNDVEEEISQPEYEKDYDNFSKDGIQEIRSQLNHKIAQLNSNIATLCPLLRKDGERCEEAIEKIIHLTPEILRDIKLLEHQLKEMSGNEVAEDNTENLKNLIETLKEVCCSVETKNSEDLFSAASKLAATTRVIQETLTSETNEIIPSLPVMAQSKGIGKVTQALLSDVQKLTYAIGNDPRADELDVAGRKCYDAMADLVICSQLTSPTIEDECSKSTLETACDNLEMCAQDLSDVYYPILEDVNFDKDTLVDKNDKLIQGLQKLKNLLNLRNDNDLNKVEKAARLKFVANIPRLTNNLKLAENKLNESPAIDNENKLAGTDKHTELDKKIGHLNAAIASLMNTFSGKPNYERRNSALETITKLVPEVICHGKSIESEIDCSRNPEIKEYLKKILDTTKNILTHAEKNDESGIIDATEKLFNSSNKLNYIVSSSLNRENKIINLAEQINDKTNELLNITISDDQLNDQDLKKIRDANSACDDAARKLKECAEILASTPENSKCRQSLKTACNNLADKLQELILVYKPLLEETGVQPNDLIEKTMQITESLDDLKHANSLETHDEQSNEPKYQVLLTAEAIAEAKKQTEKNTPRDILPEGNFGHVEDAQEFLSQNVAQINAAVASLLKSTIDSPNYNTIADSLNTISDNIPNILSAAEYISKEHPENLLFDKLNPMFKILYQMCNDTEMEKYKDINKNAMEFAVLSKSLHYENSLHTDEKKDNQIMELSKTACTDASKVLTKVYQIQQDIGGEEAATLDEYGAKIVDTAQVFLTAAQILAPTVNEQICQQTLLSFIDIFNKSINELDSVLAKTVKNDSNLRDLLSNDTKTLHSTLDKLRSCACSSDLIEDEKDQLIIKVADAKDKIEEVKNLAVLDKLHALPEPPLLEVVSVMTENNGCMEISNIEPTKMMLCDKLSELNECIALLVDKSSGRCKQELVDKIAQLTPVVVKSMLTCHKYMDDDKVLNMVEEVNALCETTNQALTSIESDDLEALNDIVSKYAYSSGKLYYIFSPYKKAESSRESEILQTVQSVCERTSLMLSRVPQLAEAIGELNAKEMEKEGLNIAYATQQLLNKAQLMAPNIRFERSQCVLKDAADQVSHFIDQLGSQWTPLMLGYKEHVTQLEDDRKASKRGLAKLLEIIKDSEKPLVPDDHSAENIITSDNNLSKNKEKELAENLHIEDTPLKELAVKILKSTTAEISNKNLSEEEKSSLKSFTNELNATIHALDIANARCKNDPLNPKKRQDLENVIQNLQHMCLVSRGDGEQFNNIIDVMDFVKEVSSATQSLYDSTISVKENHGREALDIRKSCEEILTRVENLSEPQDMTDDSALGDILRVQQFAQECDAEMQKLEKTIKSITDETSRRILDEKLQVLENKCDLLNFATKGSVSSAAAVAIEEEILNLMNAQEKIDHVLECTVNEPQERDLDKVVYTEVLENARKELESAVISGKSNLPQAITQYAIKMVTATPNESERKLRLKNHLDQLLGLLKKQHQAKSRRIATWQDPNSDDVIDINHQILKEINEFGDGASLKTDKHERNLQNLLLPEENCIHGDKKELMTKLSQQVQKLNLSVGAVILNCEQPELLQSIVSSTTATVRDILATGRAIKNKDVIQGNKIEEASKFLTAATYGLLDASQGVSESPRPENHKKLLDACTNLIRAVDRMDQASSQVDKIQREGEELQRRLQFQQLLVRSDMPFGAHAYSEAFEEIQTQGEDINKLNNDETMSREECMTSLSYVSAASSLCAQYAAHCSYLLSVEDANVAQKGLIDIQRLETIADNINSNCLKIIGSGDIDQIKTIESALNKQVQQLTEVFEDSKNKINGEDRNRLEEGVRQVTETVEELKQAIDAVPYNEAIVISRTLRLLDAINRLKMVMNRIPTPRIDTSPEKQKESKEITDCAKKLLSDTSQLVSQVTSSEDETMTWVMYGGKRVINTYQDLLQLVRNKGTELKLIPSESTEDKEQPKSYLETQIDLINKWLRNPACKLEVKTEAIRALDDIIDMGEKMCKDLKDTEQEEMLYVIKESKDLSKECSIKYQSTKASLLLERLRDLKGMLERGAVTRVVEEFLEEQPLHNIETLRKEPDTKKREFLLEKKIAELLAHLARVSRTAKLVADTSSAPIRQQLQESSKQVELLAPSLVKAVQESVRTDDEEAIENYRKKIEQYADSLTRIREMCDRAVDPMEFAQAAGETMARLKEENKNDPQRAEYSSRLIMRLGNRVVEAGMSSANVQHDPELRQTLAAIRTSIETASAKDLTNEIIRKTGEVESALGGENIFQQDPEPDQPIFAAAHGLHAAVRRWAARDNAVVAVAKRVAVLMARLSHHMYNDRKADLILTAKEIVQKSHEVAALAKTLAMECTDSRIRNDLLQVCQRIPLISGQLKMLITVKGSTLGKQGTDEDTEAMNMLVGNAQNLMTSIQEIVNVSESASVKIMSQRGRRMRWVQRSY